MIPVLIALAAAAAAAADPAAPPEPQPDPIPAAAAVPPPVAAAAEAPAKPGTPLWDNARVGMTPDQLRAAMPGVRPVADGESLLDNAKELFILPGVRLPTGLTATMAFYFREDDLNEVKLEANVPAGQTATNVRSAEVLADALKQTYGKPITCGPRQSLLAFECDWIVNGLSVSITYMDIAGEAPMLETTVRGIVSSDATPPRGFTPKKGAPAVRPGPGPSPG